MSSYTGIWRVIADKPVDPSTLALARKLVGGMLEIGSIPQRLWRLPDGSTIHAHIVNDVPNVTITRTVPVQANKTDSFDLWVPRGFLVYPAYVSAPKGVGLPVVALSTNSDPYADTNLNPGLDISRWTPGGPHGQVLLTKDVDAGYPADPNTQVVPIAFGSLSPTTTDQASYDARKTGSDWLAFRPRYSDFIQHYTQDPAAPRRAMFEAVNAYRIKNGVAAAYLWPVGFYRPAEVLSYMLDANGQNQAAFPAGYQSTAERLTKDGDWGIVPGSYAEQSATSDPIAAFTSPTGIALTTGVYPEWPVFADVGFSNGQSALSIEDRSQWIAAGRKSFQSSDTELPPISWDGYPSINLGYATLPYFLNPIGSATYALSTPLDSPSYYASFMQSQVVQRKALGSKVYCRGRAIAELPNGGLVLGAGIVTNKATDRLVVIAHQPSDNIGLDAATQGFMRYAHVWYYDFPSGGSLRLHADTFITTQWVDGGAFDVGGVKYDSLWSFNPDGSKAVCLRDHATLSDLLNDSVYSGLGEPAALVGAFVRSYPVVGYYAGALKGVVTEANFSGLGYSVSTTTLAACITVADKPGAMNTLPHAVSWLNTDSQVAYPAITPIAAEYVGGAVRVAYVARVILSTLGGYDDTETSSDYLFHDAVTFTYVGFGGTDPVYASDLTAPLLISSSSATPECDFSMVRAPQLVDMATGAFIVSGWSPRWTFDTAAYHTGPGYLEHYIPNAASPTCVLNTSAPVHRVRAARYGALLNDSTYPHPSPMLWGYMDLADRTPTHPLPSPGAAPIAFADWALSDTVQPFFATRFGETIFGYQVAANSVLRSYYDFGSNCAPDSGDYVAAVNAGTSINPTMESFIPIGGWYSSSFSIPRTNADWYSEAIIC